MNQQSFYHTKWTQWDEMKMYGPASKHVVRQILATITWINFKSVFDVGCGAGFILQQVLEKHPEVTVAGSELVETPLKLARERLPKGDFYVNDITKELPTAKKYDLVLCIDVLEHIEADVKAMENLRKLSKKYVLAVVPLGPLFQIENQRVGHVHGYSKQEFDRNFKEAGFTLVVSTQWGFPFYNLYRRLLHRLPEKVTHGHFSFKQKLISRIIDSFFFINLKNSPWGERYIALYQVEN